jgi:hypothetical protein
VKRPFTQKSGQSPPPGQVRIRVRYQQYVSPWFDYVLVSPAEMALIVRGTGWRVARYIRGRGGSYHAILSTVS